MRILCLDIPAPGATLEHYAPHLTAEALHAWGLYKSGFIRDIYFRQDRPGVAIFLECDTVEEANNVMAEFPLAKAGLLTFECIPLGSFISWERDAGTLCAAPYRRSPARLGTVQVRLYSRHLFPSGSTRRRYFPRVRHRGRGE